MYNDSPLSCFSCWLNHFWAAPRFRPEGRTSSKINRRMRLAWRYILLSVPTSLDRRTGLIPILFALQRSRGGTADLVQHHNGCRTTTASDSEETIGLYCPPKQIHNVLLLYMNDMASECPAWPRCGLPRPIRWNSTITMATKYRVIEFKIGDGLARMNSGHIDTPTLRPWRVIAVCRTSNQEHGP